MNAEMTNSNHIAKSKQAGQSQNKTIFLGIIAKNHSDFNPSGLQEALKEISEQWTEDATKLVKRMEEKISDFWINYLKEQYPKDDEWLFCVEEVKGAIVEEVVKKKVQNKAPFEESFDLKHWKQICESPAYWSDSKHIFGIQKEKGQTGKAKLLSWYDHLIKVRNKCAHNRLVTEDSVFKIIHGIEPISQTLQPRLIQHEDDGI